MVKWMSTLKKKKDLKRSGELFSLVCSTTAMKGLKTLALKKPPICKTSLCQNRKQTRQCVQSFSYKR